MQRLLAFLQESRDILAKTIACGRVIERERGSKTAPFTLSPPGARSSLSHNVILRQPLFLYSGKTILAVPERMYYTFLRIEYGQEALS